MITVAWCGWIRTSNGSIVAKGARYTTDSLSIAQKKWVLHLELKVHVVCWVMNGSMALSCNMICVAPDVIVANRPRMSGDSPGFCTVVLVGSQIYAPLSWNSNVAQPYAMYGRVTIPPWWNPLMFVVVPSCISLCTIIVPQSPTFTWGWAPLDSGWV